MYDVIRITDFSEADLTPEQRQWVEDHEFAFGVMGVNATGPVGSVEVWGMTQAYTHPTLGRLVNFTPLVEAAVIPPLPPSQWNCPNAPPGCLENAKGCLDLCLGRATGAFAIAAGALFLEGMSTYLECMAASVLLGPWALASCAFGLGFGRLALIMGAIGTYLWARNACLDAHAQDVTNCCNGFMRAPCQ